MKTNKSVAKRIRFSKPKRSRGKSAKIIQRKTGQDHFNSRESGKVTKNKRRDKQISTTLHRTIRTLAGVKK